MKCALGRKSGVVGTTKHAIILAIVAGDRDLKAMTRHHHSHVKASEQAGIKALTGNQCDAYLFVTCQALAMYDDIWRHQGEGDAKRYGPGHLDKAPRAGNKPRAEFDRRKTLVNWAGVDLTRINVQGLAAAKKILFKVGPDST